MDKSTLKNLLDLSLQNDNGAFRTIVEYFQPMIYSVAFRILCNEEDAKDLVQETFIRIWEKLTNYNPDNEFSTWIYTIAVHLCYDKLKSSKKQSGASDEYLNKLIAPENIEQELINSDLGNVILALTNQLTPKQKVVFTLRYLEGLELDEIVQITKLSRDKIKSNLFLARKTIRDKLNKL